MGSWVGPWAPFSKLSRQKAIETCEILIEQRDRQIRRAERAEAQVKALTAERDTWRTGYHNAEAATRRLRAEVFEHKEARRELNDRCTDWRERAERAESEIARWPADWETRFPCDGMCIDAPEEDCSRHGRTPAEMWGIVAEVQAQPDEHKAERYRLMKLISVRETEWDATKAKLDAVRALCDDADQDADRYGDLRAVLVSQLRAAVDGEAS